MNRLQLRRHAKGISRMLVLGAAAVLTPQTFPAAIGAANAEKAGALFSQEKGAFKILISGQQVGKEQFEISPSGGGWLVHGTSEIRSADGVTHVNGTLELHADGTPAHYEWSTQGAKKAGAAISFNGSTATIQLNVEGTQPYTQQFKFNSPQIVVLDNNLYDQYAVLARLYDREKSGAQTFSVLVPQELTPGSVTVDSAGSQDVNGKKLDELTVKSEDLEVDLFLDGERLVRIVAPTSNAEILRE
jgi:hypothetical protein